MGFRYEIHSKYFQKIKYNFFWIEINRIVVSRYDILSLIFCKYIDHNLELWLIRNRDVPDLAASLYKMLGFQIWDIFKIFWQNIKYNENLWLIMNLWKVSFRYWIQLTSYGWLEIKKFMIFRYEIYSLILCKYRGHNLELEIMKFLIFRYEMHSLILCK